MQIIYLPNNQAERGSAAEAGQSPGVGWAVMYEEAGGVGFLRR